MLDSLPQFMDAAKKQNVTIDLSARLVDIEEGNINTDREFIAKFLEYATDVQSWLTSCEVNNARMKKIAE